MEHDHDHNEGCLACEIGMEAYLANAVMLIAKHGWMVQGVAGTDDSCAFHYSVGMNLLDLPEIMIVGDLPTAIMTQLINDTGKLMMAEGKFEDGSLSSDIIRKYHVVFRQLTSETVKEHCGVLQVLCGEGQTVLQMFLPDSKGRFPWEAGCSWKFQTNGLKPLDYVSR